MDMNVFFLLALSSQSPWSYTRDGPCQQQVSSGGHIQSQKVHPSFLTYTDLSCFPQLHPIPQKAEVHHITIPHLFQVWRYRDVTGRLGEMAPVHEEISEPTVENSCQQESPDINAVCSRNTRAERSKVYLEYPIPKKVLGNQTSQC